MSLRNIRLIIRENLSNITSFIRDNFIDRHSLQPIVLSGNSFNNQVLENETKSSISDIWDSIWNFAAPKSKV
jgi:hypothetical protein